PDDEIAEIDRASGLQRPLIALVHLLRDAAGHVVVGGLHFARQEPDVLPAVDAREVLARCPDVDAEVLARPLRLSELIAIVVDGERAIEGERLGLAPQDARSGGVERRDPETLRLRPDQLRDSR